MTIGENIKTHRVRKGLTQCELAEKVGVTFGMIRRIEKGTKQPSLSNLYEIASVLETTPCELLKDVKLV